MSLPLQSRMHAGADEPAAARARDIAVRPLGRSDYESCWSAMRAFTDARDAQTRDEIWLTEHAPIYTLGLAGRREHLLRENGIPVLKVDRGGQVTYHGPGQLVVYALLDLSRAKIGVREMVRRLESVVILWLGTLGIDPGDSFFDRTERGITGCVTLVPRGETELDQARSRIDGQRAQARVAAG